MQDVCLVFFFFIYIFFWVWVVSCWRRRALKITGCMCVFVCVRAMLHWHRDGCGHPPPHSPLMTSRGHVAARPPLPSVSSSIFKQTRWTFGFPRQRCPHERTRHLCEKHRLREPGTGSVLSSRVALNSALLSKSDGCR